MTYINTNQSKEERSAKRMLALELGATQAQADRLRDCRTPKMYRMLGLAVPRRADYEAMLACIIGGV